MKFYKRKIFYVPLLILLVIIPLLILLAKPFMFISWNNLEFPSEREKLSKFLKSVKDDKTLNEFLKNYIPDRYEFYHHTYYHSKTAKRDFIIAQFLGFGWDYVLSYINAMFINMHFTAFASYISLGLKENSPNLNDKHLQFLSYIKSKNLTYLSNTQELIDYLAKNSYFGVENYKLIQAMRSALVVQILALFNDDEFCSFKKTTLLAQMQEDYQALQSIKDEKLKGIISLKFGDFDKMLRQHNNYMNELREKFNECR